MPVCGGELSGMIPNPQEKRLCLLWKLLIERRGMGILNLNYRNPFLFQVNGDGLCKIPQAFCPSEDIRKTPGVAIFRGRCKQFRESCPHFFHEL